MKCRRFGWRLPPPTASWTSSSWLIRLPSFFTGRLENQKVDDMEILGILHAIAVAIGTRLEAARDAGHAAGAGVVDPIAQLWRTGPGVRVGVVAVRHAAVDAGVGPQPVHELQSVQHAVRVLVVKTAGNSAVGARADENRIILIEQFSKGDIPADLAYGDQERGDVIRANEALTFVIEVLPEFGQRECPWQRLWLIVLRWARGGTSGRDIVDLEHIVPRRKGTLEGDDLETDVRGGRAAGLVTIQVRTGKFDQTMLDETPIEQRPHHIIDSLADVPSLLG